MQHAIEMGAVPANPLKAIKWARPRTLKTVDPRCVVNADQARRFLAAVGNQGPRGERMVAFYGCLYYAALRPEEATDLRLDNLTSLPDHGWGEMTLTSSQPRSGSHWTDDWRECRFFTVLGGRHRPPGRDPAEPTVGSRCVDCCLDPRV